MCWRKAWLHQRANNVTVECYSIPRYSYICHTDTRVQLFTWHRWHVPPDFSSHLSDSAGSVSLHDVSRRGKLPRRVRLPTGALDTETFHWSCRQLWLHSIRLRHQELHRPENSGVRDASSSHEGRGMHIFQYLYLKKTDFFFQVWKLKLQCCIYGKFNWKLRMGFILDFPEVIFL